MGNKIQILLDYSASGLHILCALLHHDPDLAAVMEYILASGCSIIWLVKHTFGSESCGLLHPHRKTELKSVLAYPRTTYELWTSGIKSWVWTNTKDYSLAGQLYLTGHWEWGIRQHNGLVSTSNVTSYSIMPWPLGQQQFFMPLMLTVIISYLEFILWCTLQTLFLLSIYYQPELFQKKFSIPFNKLTWKEKSKRFIEDRK